MGNSNLTFLKFRNVSFVWPNGRKALDECNFSIEKPGLWMLVGKNGSGKSTLFRLIRGMLKPQSGEIVCNFKQSLVFQNPDHQLLMPTCRSDLLLSCPSDLSLEESNRRINEALVQVDMEGMANRPIHTLSGGQKQRIAIAGALVSHSELLLLDEPTAFLDPKSQKAVLQVVKNLTKSSKVSITALWITHRLEELEFCDGAAIMTKGRVGHWLSCSEVVQQLKVLA